MTVWVPSRMTTKPSVAARLYAGAVDATPIDDARDQSERSPFEPLVKQFPVVVIDLGGFGDHEHLWDDEDGCR